MRAKMAGNYDSGDEDQPVLAIENGDAIPSNMLPASYASAVARGPPRTAAGNSRPRGKNRMSNTSGFQRNSLNLNVTQKNNTSAAMSSSNATKATNVILNKIEQNKYITEHDARVESKKIEDEHYRKKRGEPINYQVFDEGDNPLGPQAAEDM